MKSDLMIKRSSDLKGEILNYALSNYPAQYKDLSNLLSPCLRMKTALENNPSNSISKFGGFPNVSQDFIWPCINETPLSFLFQLDLEDIASFYLMEPIPKKGMLYFFLLTEDFNSYPEKKGEYKVIFETSLFLQKVPSSTNRVRIHNIINVELNGMDYYGNTKPQKGTNAGC